MITLAKWETFSLQLVQTTLNQNCCHKLIEMNFCVFRAPYYAIDTPFFPCLCVCWFYTPCSHEIYSVIHECEVFITNSPLVTHKFHFLCNTFHILQRIFTRLRSSRLLLLVSLVPHRMAKKHLNMHNLFACVDVIITQAHIESRHYFSARLEVVISCC